MCAHACGCVRAHTHTWACGNPVCLVVLFYNNQDFNIWSRTYFWSSLSQRLNFWDALTVYCVLFPLISVSLLWEKVQNDLKCVGFWDNSKELSHAVWVGTKVNYLGNFISKVCKRKGIPPLFPHCVCYTNSQGSNVRGVLCFPWESWPKGLLKTKPGHPPHTFFNPCWCC